MDFLTKDLVKTFSYSSANNYGSYEKRVVVNGRTYYKTGQLQTVTMVGNLYKCYDPNVESFKYMLMVGVAKQHPRDLKITKHEGLEIANEKAYSCPSIVMEVPSDFTKEQFEMFADCYIEFAMRKHLQFVKTNKELLNDEIEKNISAMN